MNTLIKTTLMSLVAMGLCSSALAEVTAVDAMLDIGYSKPADAEPIVTAKEMDDLTTEDMSKLAKELDKAGLNEKKPTGDAKYAGPVSTSKIKAIAKCDPSDGLFKMTFYVDGSATKTCLTSPGSLNHPTNLSIHGNRVRATTKLHIVSDAKSYAGAPMPNAVWIGRGKNSKGELSGFATHETGDLKNLGHPASHGCLRLNYECSKYFYDLVRRNGIDNSEVQFAGYDCGPKGFARQRGIKATAVAQNGTVPTPKARPGVDRTGQPINIIPENQRDKRAQDQKSKKTLFGVLKKIFTPRPGSQRNNNDPWNHLRGR